MNYPTEILPASNYKIIDCDISEGFLIRHCPLPEEFDDLGLPKNRTIVPLPFRMNDLSTSLYGTFNESHNNIKVINKNYFSDWQVGQSCNIPEYSNDFVLDEDRGFWYINIGNINSQEVEYEARKISATCFVVHTPALWNFWHFSIRWYIHEDESFWHDLDPDGKKKWANRLGLETIAFIKLHFRKGQLKKFDLNESCYSS